MRIAIDARMMGPENTRGIGRYIEELIRAMLQVAPEHEYVLIARRADHVFASHPSVQTIVADIPWYGIAEQLKMPKILRSTRADVVFVPHWNVPILYRGPLVVMIHDLLLRHNVESAKASTRGFVFRSLKRIGFRLTLDHAIRAAKIVLVPAKFVADDVATLYPEAKQKIVISGEGMPAIVERLTTGSASSTPYLLYVGSAYPHKGLADLLEAWKTIAVQHPNLRLVIAGELDVFMKRVKAGAEHDGLVRIDFLGRVTDQKLDELYRDALAFVYPTHFEGFGLPPLEAIARGCPVISSDAGPLPDVLGANGAVFFRAGSADAIIPAVTQVANEPEAARQHVRSVASALAERHDWKRVARITLDAYARSLTLTSHGTQDRKRT